MLSFIVNFIQKSVNFLGYRIISFKDPVIDEDKQFMEIYDKCKNYTMTSKEKMYALYKSVEYVIHAKIPGDFVECGVWKGGSMMLIACALIKLKVTNRKIVLYDTFEGMPPKEKEDKRICPVVFGSSVFGSFDSSKKRGKKWCYSSLSEVKKNMSRTKYPKKNIIFIKGNVQDTIPKNVSSKISLLRLDTDFYASTKHELVSLFPRLSKNGVLIIDDYGSWQGQKKAVDEYFFDKNILLNRISRGARIGIKI